MNGKTTNEYVTIVNLIILNLLNSLGELKFKSILDLVGCHQKTLAYSFILLTTFFFLISPSCLISVSATKYVNLKPKTNLFILKPNTISVSIFKEPQKTFLIFRKKLKWSFLNVLHCITERINQTPKANSHPKTKEKSSRVCEVNKKNQPSVQSPKNCF